jgi:hypothetical protein
MIYLNERLINYDQNMETNKKTYKYLCRIRSNDIRAYKIDKILKSI